ncbi:hypothetical protein HK405_014228, partial [Cladochytrium tenue]
RQRRTQAGDKLPRADGQRPLERYPLPLPDQRGFLRHRQHCIRILVQPGVCLPLRLRLRAVPDGCHAHPQACRRP